MCVELNIHESSVLYFVEQHFTEFGREAKMSSQVEGGIRISNDRLYFYRTRTGKERQQQGMGLAEKFH